jgi:hypothetical protein
MTSHKSTFKMVFVILIAGLITFLGFFSRGHFESNQNPILFIIYAILFIYITAHKQVEGDFIYSIYCFIRIRTYDLTETIEISFQERKATYWYSVKDINNKECIFSTTDTNLGDIFRYIVQHSKHQVTLDASALARTRNE